MEITHSRIDLSQYVDRRDPPADVVRRELAQDRWHVLGRPIDVAQPVSWDLDRKSEHIYVPLFPYITPDVPEVAMSFLFQLGFYASRWLATTPRRLHLAIGSPVEQVVDGQTGKAGLRLYFGVAAVLEK